MSALTRQHKGVIATCTDSAKIPHTKEFTTCDLNADHPIFTHGAVSELSLLLGIPLVVMKWRPSLAKPARHLNDNELTNSHQTISTSASDHYFPNVTATTLMFRCANAVEAEAKGARNAAVIEKLQAPVEWTDSVGDILVARRDRQPLYALHVVSMLAFVYGLIEEASLSEQAKVMRRLTPRAFLEFYEAAMGQFQVMTLPKGARRAPSPFEPVNTPSSLGRSDAPVQRAEDNEAQGSWSAALRDW